MKKFNFPEIGNVEINPARLHILTMLAATYKNPQDSFIFINDEKLLAALLQEELCVPYSKNGDAVVGTEKLVHSMSSVEIFFNGVN